jgi:hypothetical protein
MCTNIKQIAMEKIMKNCLKLPVFFLVFMVLNPFSFFLTAAIDTQARAEGRNDAVGLATSSQGFDKAYYLDAKLTQLKTIDPATWNSYSADDIETLLARYGFTAESHYWVYGWTEGLSPNASFDQGQYLYAKGVRMYQTGNYGTVSEAIAAFKAAWPGDPYLHYLFYGAAEGLSPKGGFNEDAYLSDKLSDLAAADPSGWGGRNIAYLRSVLASVGMSPITHYLTYGRLEGNDGPYPVDRVPSDYQGNWEGSFSGTDIGYWSALVDSDGSVSGQGFSYDLQASFVLRGECDAQGNFVLVAVNGDVSTGAMFIGGVDIATRTISGTWLNNRYTEEYGIFSGAYVQ